MRIRVPLPAVSAAVLAFALLGLATPATVVGCKPTGRTANGPTRPIASWTGEEAKLFDDGIDVGALHEGSGPAPRDEANEEKIADRFDYADGVVLGKVVGVTSEPSGDRKRYRVELAVEGEPLGGKAPHALTLAVEPDAPAFGTIRAMDARLIGRKLVVFFRSYAAEDEGEPITHFHMSPASPAVLDAISVHKTRKQFE